MRSSRVKYSVVYPVNKDVPTESLSLGQILDIFEKTHQLVAPILEGQLECAENEDGSVSFPTKDKVLPLYISKIEVSKRGYKGPVDSVPQTETSGQN